ncbi:MAG TPA: glycosyltransferase [Piscinibacter sp.]|nr:glycosyltransferase [Piscinibacter sp.]
MKRILVYSHDTFGLGNIRRMLEVARHLVQSSGEVSVLVITGSPMLHAFRIPDRIDYVKLPCLSRNVDGRYGARTLPISLEQTVRLRANLIRSAIADFEPDLILVDKKPFGVEDELAGALEAMSSSAKRPKLVLLLRDILDSAESTTRVWRKNGYFEAISAYYDQVLVVGCPEVYDLRREYDFPPFAAAKVRFCGYIAREAGRQPREAVRRTLGVDAKEPLLLVTPGGGEDGHELVSNVMRALHAMPASQRPRTHIVCGPEMSEPRRAAVHQAAQALTNASVQDFCDDMMSLMSAADVVVAMGGYNTVCELLTLRKRALIVPRVKPGTEQSIRAERMAAMGFLRMLHPDLLSPTTMLAALQSELAAWRAQQKPVALRRLDGLARVSAALFEAMDHRPVAPVAAADARPEAERRPTRNQHASNGARGVHA